MVVGLISATRSLVGPFSVAAILDTRCPSGMLAARLVTYLPTYLPIGTFVRPCNLLRV